MPAHRADFVVFAKDYPEVRLIVEVKSSVVTPRNDDPTIQQLVQEMWSANCHYGLIVTPHETFVLRDDFSKPGPESIRVSDSLPTATLFSRIESPLPNMTNGRQLEWITREWLVRLTESYEDALPDDPAVTKALFPEIVGAVSEGRVAGEVVAR